MGLHEGTEQHAAMKESTEGLQMNIKHIQNKMATLNRLTEGKPLSIIQGISYHRCWSGHLHLTTPQICAEEETKHHHHHKYGNT